MDLQPNVAQTVLPQDPGILEMRGQQQQQAYLKRLAELLQSTDQTEAGSMVSGYYVPTSPYSHAGDAIAKVAGAGLGAWSDQNELDIQNAQGEAMAGQTDPQKLASMLMRIGHTKEGVGLMGDVLKSQGDQAVMNPDKFEQEMQLKRAGAMQISPYQQESLDIRRQGEERQGRISPYQQESLEIQRQAGVRAATAADRATDAALRAAENAERRFQFAEKKESVRHEERINPPISSKDRTTAKLKIINLSLAKKQLADIKAAYAGMKTRDQINPLSEAGRKFDRAIDSFRNTKTGLTRVPGIGAMSDYDAQLDQAALPSRMEFPGNIEAQIQSLDQLIETMQSGYGDLLGSRANASP